MKKKWTILQSAAAASLWLSLFAPSKGHAEVGGLQALPPPVLRANVAANTSFEEGAGGPQNWSLGSWRWNTTDARTGSHCLAVTNVGGTAVQAIQVLPQPISFRALRLRAWVKTIGAIPGRGAEFSIALDSQTYGGSVNSGHNIPMKLGGGLAGWTQYTLADDMTWGSFLYGSDLRIKLVARNIPDGVTLLVDDVTAEPVIVPLTIFPLYPNYRGMLWPDQGTLMKWKAIVEPPDGYTLPQLMVQTEILDAAKNPVAAPVTLTELAKVNSTGGLGAQWPGVSLNTQSFKADDLANGVYYLRGKLVDAGTKEVVFTYPDYKIVKEPPSQQRDHWNVWVDRYNRVVLDKAPRFVWGGFLQPNFAANTYSNGRADPYSEEAPYRNIAISNPPKGAGTMLGVMADLGMNTDIYYGNLAAANIGIVNNTGGSGTITSDGTEVSGLDTRFTTQLAPGDTILVTGQPGTGSISTYNEVVVGTGTRFTQELKPFDRITVAGKIAIVASIVSDTRLILQLGISPDVASASFTYDSYRTVTSVQNDTRLIIDEPFTPNLATPQPFRRNLCSGWNPSYSQLLPYIDAAQRLGIWHLHITADFHPASRYNPTWAKACRLDAAAAVSKLLTHPQSTGGILGNRVGWLGTYVADEPAPNSPIEGRAAAFSKARAAMDAKDPATGKSLGGVNYWVDGLQPVQTWNQWANFMDAGGPDPYPVGVGRLADDVVFGIPNGRLHGRSYWWPRAVAGGQFDSRPLWTTIQLFRANTVSGLPTAADQKIQLVSALAAGSTGIFWWTIAGNTGLGSVATDEQFEDWRKGGKVIASLLPLLNEPVRDLSDRLDDQPRFGRLLASISDPSIKCASWNLDAQVLLACANTTNRRIQAAIQMTDPIEGEVTLPWNGSSITPTGNRFSVEFAPLQDGVAPENSVHLFRLKLKYARSTDTRTCRDCVSGPGRSR